MKSPPGMSKFPVTEKARAVPREIRLLGAQGGGA